MQEMHYKEDDKMDQIEGYLKEKRTISIGLANLYSIIIAIFLLITFNVIFYGLWKNNVFMYANFFDTNSFFITIIVVLVGIILHEFLHGIVFSIFAKNGLKSIKIGILLKLLTPYCHCKEPLKVSEFIIGALTPTIVLGILPLIIALIMGNIFLLQYGILFIIAGSGDLMFVKSMLKEKKDSLIYDLPTEFGYYIFKKIK